MSRIPSTIAAMRAELTTINRKLAETDPMRSPVEDGGLYDTFRKSMSLLATAEDIDRRIQGRDVPF